MDKYEYKLKSDQMKALAAEGEYAAAAEIADSINWRKVKNVNSLVKAGDIYAKQKRYDEAREILLMAYDRTPIGRMIIYRLAEIAVKMKNVEEAEEYYNEFVELAPHDNLKYVLRYKISRVNGSDIQTQIAILEEYKESEYTEEWAYQLAFLYHKAGESEKCIDACDELILWFGDGIYVERALELKMLYQPLTKSQEGKYRALKQRRDGVKEVYPQEENVVRIPVVSESVERFNTANLQEELAKSMQQILDATEKETVDDTMDNIKRMVEEIPYLKMPGYETASELKGNGRFETDAKINDSLRDNFKEMLSEDYDGEYGVPTDEDARDSQMSIEDVLSDWEKTRRAAQAALKMAQQQKLESAKARALQEARDIMERLADMIPKLDAGITPTQMLQEEYLQENVISNEERAGRAVADMNDMLQQQIDRLQEEVNDEPEQEVEPERKTEPELLRKIKQAKPNFDEKIGLRPYKPRQFEPIQEPDIPPETEEEPECLEEENLSEEMLLAEAEFYGISPEELKEKGLPNPEPPKEPPSESALFKQDTKEIKTKKIAEALDKQIQEALYEEQPEQKIEKQEIPEDPKDFKEEPKDSSKKAKLNAEQKKIFSYFVPVEGMERQICQVLTRTSKRLAGNKPSASGNILIQGGTGCGKTVLATSLIKALQKEVKRPNGKVGKIDAKALNTKDLSKLLSKVAGGCLIIERASEMTRETAVKLSLLLDNDKSGVLLIMEDTRAGLEQALGNDEGFAKKFTEKIKIPVFTSDELVEFGKAYANDLDYEIDNMGVLALYNRISNIQRLDQATTLTEVKEIVDEAIENAEKKTLKKAFSILTSRRYTENDYVILREKDFEE